MKTVPRKQRSLRLTWGRRFQTGQYLKGSLWVLPLAGAIIGVGLAALDLRAEPGIVVPEALRYSAGTASGVLTAIVGAMVGLLGFVVTIGVLVVQSATGTLSPRFMRIWYRDRLQKVVLATFITTLAFSFTLLGQVETNYVPDLGVSIAGTAVVFSLVLLLLYLNRFTHRLRPVAVAELMAHAARRGLAADGAVPRRPLPDGSIGKLSATEGPPTWVVRSARSGALQAMDERGLVEVAHRHGCVILVVHPVGDYVPSGEVLFAGYGGTNPPDERRVRGLVAFGAERTIEQDPAFALRVMVDIAIRALSAAINDPTTAVQVTDHIESVVRVVGTAPRAGEVALVDRDGRACVLVPTHSWEDYLRLAVTEIRVNGGRSVQVCRRLRALFDELGLAVLPEHRAAVEAEVGRLDATVDANFSHPAERAFAKTSDRQGVGGPSAAR